MAKDLTLTCTLTTIGTILPNTYDLVSLPPISVKDLPGLLECRMLSPSTNYTGYTFANSQLLQILYYVQSMEGWKSVLKAIFKCTHLKGDTHILLLHQSIVKLCLYAPNWGLVKDLHSYFLPFSFWKEKYLLIWKKCG